MMKDFLENKWSTQIKYSCEHCLQIAYKSELNNEIGYITDEEIMKSSTGKLKYK